MTDSSITITKEEILVRRSQLARSLAPDLSINPSSLVGWRIQEPTETSPGWLHFLIDEAPSNQYLRSFTEASQNPAAVHFFPGEAEALRAVDQQLSNLQAGFDLAASPRTLTKDSVDEGAAGTRKAAAASEKKASTRTGGKTQAKGKRGNRAPWDRVATPDEVPEQNTQADIDGPVFGDTVVLTGDVEPYSKGEVWDMLAQAGAIVAKNVTKKTTLLIVGEWATTTSKEKRARELQEQGQELRIWSFEELLTALGVEH